MVILFLLTPSFRMQYKPLICNDANSFILTSLQVLSPFYTPFCYIDSAEVSYTMVLGRVMHFMHNTLDLHVASIISYVNCNREETSDSNLKCCKSCREAIHAQLRVQEDKLS